MRPALFKRKVQKVMIITNHQLRRIIERVDSKLGAKNKLVIDDPSSNTIQSVKKDVHDIIQMSYKNIGGHPTLNSGGSLEDKYDTWAVADVDEDPEPDVVYLGSKNKRGIKIGASGTDGSDAAKAAWKKFKKKLNDSGWWGEVSGAPAALMIKKMNASYVDDESLARELLKGKDITWHGAHPTEPERWEGINGWYTREIGGHPHAKIIIGNF
jgi:hypothetical protein